MAETDILIVGAGSAGCTLAARLSENPQLHVTLVEAGTPSHNPWVDIPIGYFKTVGNPRFDWCFETEPDPAMGNRRIAWPRGKGPGGTSLINGMLYLRGHARDYDQWTELGNPGWGWRDVLPYFIKSEGRVDAKGPTDGRDGPLRVSDLPRDTLSDAFIAAAGHSGIPATDDFNTGNNAGAGYLQMTAYKGRRMSTARAYLDPARKRSNLRVVSGLHATRLLLKGGRAVGAEFDDKGRRVVVKARHQVVLCAGAIQSPQLLQLSGIGDPALLERVGVSVQCALPGVGANLQDHLQVRPSYRCQGVETLNEVANSHLLGAREFGKYMINRSGALSAGVYRAGAFLSLASEAAWPDVQIHFGLVSFDKPHQPPHPFPGITLSACILRPYSRGRIEIGSSDPLQAPRIHHGYLQDERDRQLAVAMVRKMRDIAAAPPLARYISAEYEPGSAQQGDAELLEWVRQRSASIFHPVGSCAMGPDDDPMAVLDHRLRVKGVKGLRVVDGAAMPRLVSGNTNAPIIMMAEKAADLIKEELSA